jgi:hypothetical protein
MASLTFQLTPILGVAALAALMTACDSKPAAPAKPIAEIRGAPIGAPAANATAPGSADASTSDKSQAQNQSTTAAEAPTAATSGKTAPAEDAADGYLNIGFDKLSAFNYEIPEEQPAATNKTAATAAPPVDQIPKVVRALDNKSVSLRGYMLPLKVEGGLITELLIMRDQSMCCYGAVPRINEWVSVKMTGKGVKPIMDQTVTFYGKLHVGEIRENGYLVGIYAMDGDKMAGPLDL